MIRRKTIGSARRNVTLSRGRHPCLGGRAVTMTGQGWPAGRTPSSAGRTCSRCSTRSRPISAARILKYLSQPTGRYAPFYAPDPEVVRHALKPGDILLVEGNSRLAATIKYLTQSTWSHAALYVGERPGDVSADRRAQRALGGRSRYRRRHRAAVEIRPLPHPHLPRRRRRRRKPAKGHRLRHWRASARSTTSGASSIWRAICFLIRRCRCGFAAACCRSAAAIRPAPSARP